MIFLFNILNLLFKFILYLNQVIFFIMCGTCGESNADTGVEVPEHAEGEEHGLG